MYLIRNTLTSEFIHSYKGSGGMVLKGFSTKGEAKAFIMKYHLSEDIYEIVRVWNTYFIQED